MVQSTGDSFLEEEGDSSDAIAFLELNWFSEK